MNQSNILIAPVDRRLVRRSDIVFELLCKLSSIRSAFGHFSVPVHHQLFSSSEKYRGILYQRIKYKQQYKEKRYSNPQTADYKSNTLTIKPRS